MDIRCLKISSGVGDTPKLTDSKNLFEVVKCVSNKSLLELLAAEGLIANHMKCDRCGRSMVLTKRSDSPDCVIVSFKFPANSYVTS